VEESNKKRKEKELLKEGEGQEKKKL